MQGAFERCMNNSSCSYAIQTLLVFHAFTPRTSSHLGSSSEQNSPINQSNLLKSACETLLPFGVFTWLARIMYVNVSMSPYIARLFMTTDKHS